MGWPSYGTGLARVGEVVGPQGWEWKPGGLELSGYPGGGPGGFCLGDVPRRWCEPAGVAGSMGEGKVVHQGVWENREIESQGRLGGVLVGFELPPH